MKFKNNEEFFKFFDGLPKDLQDIYSSVYDEVGRPVVENPKKEIIISLIKKNNTSSNDFVRDVQIFYPTMDSNDVEIYYHSFISGMMTLQEMLAKSLKQEV